MPNGRAPVPPPAPVGVARSAADLDHLLAPIALYPDPLIAQMINGHMIGGFALVAWPAEWGNSGLATFIVNQQGKVYEKNLGPKTSATAPRLGAFNPDQTWILAKEH